MIEARLRLARPGFALDVDLALPARGVTAVFGPSGCGKTTVLRAIAGLEHAAGRVVIGSEVWQDDAAGVFVPTHRRDIGYVIQEAALFPHLTVQQNLDYGRSRVGPDRHRIAIDRTVELLGIGALMDRRPATLSGGERQRVAIARALALGPSLLLMDEPLAALDAERKAEVLPHLERLHSDFGMPVLYVSHAIDEVARLADHLVMLRAGRVLAAGPLADLLARPDLPLSRPDDAGVVIMAEVAEHDRRYALTRIVFDGASLWVGTGATVPGQRVRARVLARDVSLARVMPLHTSVINLLPATVEDLHFDGSTVLVRLRTGASTPLLARITRRSADTLSLAPGDPVIAQVKGVALM